MHFLTETESDAPISVGSQPSREPISFSQFFLRPRLLLLIFLVLFFLFYFLLYFLVEKMFVGADFTLYSITRWPFGINMRILVGYKMFWIQYSDFFIFNYQHIYLKEL